MYKIQFLFSTFLMVTVVSLSLGAQTATPAKVPTRVAAAEQEKKITRKVNPKYPKEAFEAKITGLISLETTIGVDGKVTNVRPLTTGDAALIKAAVDAVKQWVYKPTKINGMYVEVMTIVQVNFKVGE